MKVEHNIDAVMKQMRAEAQKAIEMAERELQLAALEIEREAKLRAPVDTGMLRGSITSTGGGSEYEIGTNVEYAPFIEYGTSKMSAQPFLSPAFELVVKELPIKIEKAVKSVFN